MPSDKDRLYVALYARGGSATMPGGEDRYHWALLVGPKTEDQDSRGMRFHAKEGLALVNGQGQSVWSFEEREIGMAPTAMILVRVMVAKIKNRDRVLSILRGLPIRGGEAGWNCVAWVKEALEALQRDGKALGTSRVDWETVRDAAMQYAREKEAAHRFDGQAGSGQFDVRKVPTWDLLTGREAVP
ncbi:hypothetical protein FDECE_15397 [Fusarium decemcellulare]|nr:hypothetical protein FDECE_15397 [Fusarium decemcellulare]